MEKVSFNAELIGTLKSKQDWINRVPRCLPPKREAEVRVWLDKNGNCLSQGEDFMAADDIDSYPVRVYSCRRVAEFVKQVNKS